MLDPLDSKLYLDFEIIQKYDITKKVEALPTNPVPIFTLLTNFPHEDVITPIRSQYQCLQLLLLYLYAI